MAVLNFTEIESGEEFELFACALLPLIGLRVIDGPDRGTDEGRDIIAVGKEDPEFRWLVSCKHNAHAKLGNGRAVNKSDENDILDRMEYFNCQGFISFCSTIQSSKLNNYIQEFIKRGKIKKYNPMHKGNIENTLLTSPDGELIASRYFKSSYNEWVKKGRQASSTYVIQQNFILLIDSYKNQIISNLRMLSIMKSMLLKGIPLKLQQIELAEQKVLEINNIICTENQYILEDIENRFESVEEIIKELDGIIQKHRPIEGN